MNKYFYNIIGNHGAFLIIFLFAFSTNKVVADSYKFDRAKKSLSFKYSKEGRSISGKLVDWNVQLYPNGLLEWSGIYFETLPLRCSEKGGSFSTKISKKNHSLLIELAQKAYKDNLSKKNIHEINSPDTIRNHLFFEMGKNIGIAEIKTFTENTKFFLEKIEKLIKWPVENDKYKIHALKVHPALLTKKKITVTIENIGNEIYCSNYLKKDQKDFFILTKNGKRVDLRPLNNKFNKKPLKIAPKELLKIDFKPSSFVDRNNFSEIFYNSNNQQVSECEVNSITLHICNIVIIEKKK